MTTRLLDIGCYFRHQAAWPTAAVFQVTPQANDRVEILDPVWRIEPDVPVHSYTDSLGSVATRLVMPAGVSVLEYRAQARVADSEDPSDPEAKEIAAADLPDDTLVYTLASRFCQPDVLGQHAWRLFGDVQPGWTRVQTICTWVNTYLRYTTGSTVPTSTSVDAFSSGMGVCRDFAHLMITMCRALNIPARYAFGYLPDMDVPPLPTPMDFHAWVQVWLGDQWWDFDPRHDQRRKGRVQIGQGRDAADAAMVTTYGAPWLQLMTVTAQEATEPVSG